MTPLAHAIIAMRNINDSRPSSATATGGQDLPCKLSSFREEVRTFQRLFFRPAYTTTTSKMVEIYLATDQPTLNAMPTALSVWVPSARAHHHAAGYMMRSTSVKPHATTT
jgi:hypothetical protein